MEFTEYDSEDYISTYCVYKCVRFPCHSNMNPLEASKMQVHKELPAGSYLHTQVGFLDLALGF